MIVSIDVLLLVSTLVWPLFLVLAMAVAPLRDIALKLVPTAALPALLASMLPSPDLEFEVTWLLLSTSVGLDDVSGTYLLLSSILWIAGSLSLPTTGQLRFTLWFLITMFGNFAVLLSRDIPFFFVSFAVMSLASFGMIIHDLTKEARRAAIIYLLFAIAGEIILLAALVLVAHNAGSLEIEHVIDRTPQHMLMALLLIGFGIKAGVPLLHMALPPVYMVTPLAAVVPMAGGLLHLGLYGWMRFLPFGYENLPLWSGIFISTGVVAVFYAVLVGLTQRNTRSLLAYSSISQMGLMTIGVGVGLGATEYWPIIQNILLLFVLHHALAKGALFYGLGIKGRASQGLWLPALALAGLPFTGGALAKTMLKSQLYLLPDQIQLFLSWILPLSSIATTLLMLRFLNLFFKEESTREQSLTIVWWCLLALVMLLPWFWPLSLDLHHSIWSSTWPVLIAVVPAWFVYRGRFTHLLTRVPSIPPGDLLPVIERLLRRVPWPHPTHHEHVGARDTSLQTQSIPTLIALPERWLARWQVAVGLLAVLVLIFFFMANRT